MLEGKNVILRLFAEDDLDEFLTLYSKYSERGEFYPVGFPSMAASRTQFTEKGWWDEHEGRMLVTDKDGRMLGFIFFFKGAKYQEGYEVGYTILRQEDRGQGIMTEALRIFSAYLFELKPIARLCLLTARGNAASQKVARKCGYQHEGTLRRAFFLRGEYHDCELFSLLRDECPSTREALGASA